VKVQPISLEGSLVRLDPLEPHHGPHLLAAAADAAIFRWMSFSLTSDESVGRFVRGALRLRESGHALPYVIASRSTGSIIGATGYWHIEPHHRRLEIGGSWLSPTYQRSGANTEAKYLLLRHAFESLGCIRVEFLTHVLNERSRAALRRLGATEEGIFRNHMIQPDGSLRSSACYSIISEEWPRVRTQLQDRMATHTVEAPSTPGDAAAPDGLFSDPAAIDSRQLR
jgi:RimJ/RimL family protein N-acetyltransferase